MALKLSEFHFELVSQNSEKFHEDSTRVCFLQRFCHPQLPKVYWKCFCFVFLFSGIKICAANEKKWISRKLQSVSNLPKRVVLFASMIAL